MPSQYGELQPTIVRDRLAGFGHPGKYQRGSRLGFATAATSLNGNQPNFARCLTVCWAGILHNIVSGVLPLTEFFARCKIHFTSKSCGILAALLHGTPAAGVSQTLRRGTRNGITELSERALPIFGRAAITLGIRPHSSSLFVT